MTASGKRKIRAKGGQSCLLEDCLGNEEKCVVSVWVASLLSGKSKLVGFLLLDVWRPIILYCVMHTYISMVGSNQHYRLSDLVCQPKPGHCHLTGQF